MRKTYRKLYTPDPDDFEVVAASRKVLPEVMIRELYDEHDCECKLCDSEENKEKKKLDLTEECYNDFKATYKDQFYYDVRK